ncbi:MAG TPA: MoxR family ATPase [Nitriliruptorales bacterium]
MATSTRSKRTTKAKAMDAKTFKENFDGLVKNVEIVIKGKTDVVRLALVAMLCEGHVLFEDVPGTGKSVLARALAQSMNAESNRVQCTPDILPGDITGSSIFDQRKGQFEFQPGPIFCRVFLVDEVNRATPKTQSALLEAMAERRVSSDGVTRNLARPFFVLATQNPIETAGTFPLPEAQLDRFIFKLSMGYLDREHELEVMFDNSIRMMIDDLGSMIDPEDVQEMIDYGATVEVSREVGLYIVDLVNASRKDPAVAMGGSPRASINLLRASRVLAASDGRDHVYPDDVRAVLQPIMAHRIVLNPESLLRGESIADVLERIVGSVKPPLTGRSQSLEAVS